MKSKSTYNILFIVTSDGLGIKEVFYFKYLSSHLKHVAAKMGSNRDEDKRRSKEDHDLLLPVSSLLLYHSHG